MQTRCRVSRRRALGVIDNKASFASDALLFVVVAVAVAVDNERAIEDGRTTTLVGD